MNQLRHRSVTGFCRQHRHVLELRTLCDLDTGNVAIQPLPLVTQMFDLMWLKVCAIVECFVPIHNWLQSSHRYLQPLSVAAISARLKRRVDSAVEGAALIDATSLPRKVVENVLTKCGTRS